MTKDQYRAALERLGLTQAAAAEFFGVTARTGRSWALGETPVPKAVAILLRVMLKTKATPKKMQRLAS